MSSDGERLTGLWFEGSRDSSMRAVDCMIYCGKMDLPAFRETSRWLDAYFAGRNPDFTPQWEMEGLTPFRRDVVDAMLSIEFGKTLTYGEIAKTIAGKRGMGKVSAQAVGGAVGWNPICIVIPCHRVIGANGSLTGYGGGMQNKIALLEHEKHALDRTTAFI